MEQFESWPGPLPFIEKTEKGGLQINAQTAHRLSAVKLPLVVVAIAGVYRTGKSYLMNRLAGGTAGFPLGNTIEAKTKGIWAWCLQHPHDENKALLLLDTEGLSDASKGDAQHDMKIFTLAVLLSGTFVFNAIGRIDQEMIDKLYFVTELTDAINVKTRSSNNEQDTGESRFEEYTEYFPHFVLAVRDFMLELKLEDEVVSPREYFEHTLTLRKGTTKSVVFHNLPREAIRQAFKSYDCFVFARPVQEDKLFLKLDHVTEDQLTPKFQSQSKRFYDHVLDKSQPKKLKSHQMITGQTFVVLAEQYVNCINNGTIPCIESTVTLVADNTNRQLQEECEEKYLELLSRLVYPVSEEELQELHKTSYSQAMINFRQHAVFDEEGKVFKCMTDNITKAFCNIVEKNAAESTRRAMQVIEKLYSELVKEKIYNHEYTIVGGYKMYSEDMARLEDQYKAIPNLGPKKEEVLVEFLAERKNERITIMGADSKMSERDKELELERKAKETAEMLKNAAEKDIKSQEERLKRLQKEHEQQSQKICEDYKKKEEQKKKEMEALVQKRLKEKERLITEGHNRKAKEMEDEIKKLRLCTNIQTGIQTFCQVMDRVVAAATVFGPMIQSARSANQSSAPEAEGGRKSPPGTVGGTKSRDAPRTPENKSSLTSSDLPNISQKSTTPKTTAVPSSRPFPKLPKAVPPAAASAISQALSSAASSSNLNKGSDSVSK